MEVFTKNTVLKSNTKYVAEQSVIDIYLEDTVQSDDRLIMSGCRLAPETCQIGFDLQNLSNIEIDFNGAKLVFHGRIVPFVLRNCKNIVLKNFKIDYDRPYYTQADVIEVSKNEIKMKICDGFDYEIKDGYLYAKSDSWVKNLNQNDCMLWMLDKTGKKQYNFMLGLFGKEIFPYDNPPAPILQLQIREEDGYQIVSGDFPEDWETNDGNNALLITHEFRDKSSIVLLDSEDIKIENFVLIHGAGMGVLGLHSKNITFNHYDIFRNFDGNGHLVTNNADAIHLFFCGGKIVLENSYMEGMLDDVLNVHNNYLAVKSVDGNRLTTFAKSANYETVMRLFAAGDKIRIERGNTLEKVSELVICSIDVNLLKKECYLIVEGDTSGIEENDTIENLTDQPEVIMRDCKFGNMRGTTRLQSRSHTVVENCIFTNKDLSLLFSGDKTYWYESGPVNDLTIRNCVFEHTGGEPRIYFRKDVEFTEKEPYYHRNITVENCIFKGKGLIAHLCHTDNFVFKNNTFEKGSYIIAEQCGTILSQNDVEIRRI